MTLQEMLENVQGDLKISHNGVVDGKQVVIIHAFGINSEALDFVVDGNQLVPVVSIR